MSGIHLSSVALHLHPHPAVYPADMFYGINENIVTAFTDS